MSFFKVLFLSNLKGKEMLSRNGFNICVWLKFGIWNVHFTEQSTGWLFWLVPPRQAPSMKLVPTNRETLLSSKKLAKIPSKKVKIQVRACETLIYYAKFKHKVMGWQALTWTFTFSVGIFAIFVPVPIVRSFLGGTSQRIHPVECAFEDISILKVNPSRKYLIEMLLI